MQSIPRFEWLLIELIVLGFLCYELWSIRRIRRQDRADKARPPAQPGPDP